MAATANPVVDLDLVGQRSRYPLAALHLNTPSRDLGRIDEISGDDHAAGQASVGHPPRETILSQLGLVLLPLVV